MEARQANNLADDFMAKNNSAPQGVIFQPLAHPSDRLKESLSANPAAPDHVLDAWLKSVVPPTTPPQINSAIPDISLRLEHVYGYRCQDMRNNVRYGGGGGDNVIFVSATLGVSMHKTSGAQNFFRVHTEAITAIATSRDGLLVCTGQMGHEPVVAVWDARTLATLAILPDLQLNGVSCLAFSNDNKLIATVSMDSDHTLSVYDWRRRLMVSRCYGGVGHIFDACFSDDDFSGSR